MPGAIHVSVIKKKVNVGSVLFTQLTLSTVPDRRNLLAERE